MITLIKGPFTLEAREAAVQREIAANYDVYFVRAMRDRPWVADHLKQRAEINRWPRVSGQTAEMILGFLGVEFHEPDYVFAAINGAGDSLATRETYWQWGNEERRHWQALRYCLIDARLFTQEKVDRYLHETAQVRWTFEEQTGLDPDPLFGALYAVAQERHTRKDYTALRYHIWRQYGSPRSINGRPVFPGIAGIIRYPEIDEGHHEANFRRIALIYLKYFPDKVLEAMLQIYGSRYRMPIIHLPNSEKFINAVLESGVDTPREYISEVLRPSIQGMGLKDRKALKQAAKKAWDLPEGAAIQLPGKPITELSESSASSIYEMNPDGSFVLVEQEVV